jgi:SAM-dependent methyltransferase
MNDREAFLREFHAAKPGITQRVFARGGTYERLAERVPRGRVLDLACGDGPLLKLLDDAVGVDISLVDLQLAGQGVQARAQQLPFANRSFDAATCHLAFMLFDDIELVVAELARVLRPGAPFIALVGGGPTADGRDAFHAYAERVSRSRSFGDRRASSEAGWRELFRDWSGDIAFERWPIDLSGTFDEVWELLAATYAHPADDAAIRDALRAEFPGERVPCTFVTFCATVRR